MLNLQNLKKVLVLAPHTDDGELGCGGFITKLIENNVEVFYVAFSTAEESVPPGFPKDIFAVRAAPGLREIFFSGVSLARWPPKSRPGVSGHGLNGRQED